MARDWQQGVEDARKVFVGGVPQYVSSEELYSIFAPFAAVKKAWLQRCRPGDDSETFPPQLHRGFGFVIFHDAHAVDGIIGPGASRLIDIGSGHSVEVKRAVSSKKMERTRAPHPRDGSAIDVDRSQPHLPRSQGATDCMHQHTTTVSTMSVAQLEGTDPWALTMGNGAAAWPMYHPMTSGLALSAAALLGHSHGNAPGMLMSHAAMREPISPGPASLATVLGDSEPARLTMGPHGIVVTGTSADTGSARARP